MRASAAFTRARFCESQCTDDSVYIRTASVPATMKQHYGMKLRAITDSEICAHGCK
jgi:hypothetical protein